MVAPPLSVVRAWLQACWRQGCQHCSIRSDELIEKHLKPARKFEFWQNDEEFYKVAAKTPRSNCVMDASKLLAAGVKIRGVEEALEHALKNWKPE